MTGKSMNNKKVKRKRSKKRESTPLHSITFYIPNKKIDFFNEILKEVSKEIYKESGKRCVSRYIRDLIYKDLQDRGYLDSNFEPKIEKLGGSY